MVSPLFLLLLLYVIYQLCFEMHLEYLFLSVGNFAGRDNKTSYLMIDSLQDLLSLQRFHL